MKLEHELTAELQKQVLEIIGRYLNFADYKIFFFGSRVLGTNSERSDIDIGIQGDQPIDSRILGKIQEDIAALPILYKIDLVDFQRAAPDFKQLALQATEPLRLYE